MGVEGTTPGEAMRVHRRADEEIFFFLFLQTVLNYKGSGFRAIQLMSWLDFYWFVGALDQEHMCTCVFGSTGCSRVVLL